ncbi:MAG TPA: phage Gp37/Gp68 family protein [Aestuariivirga sp.]|nr:phage Gp37/Gp68 family protein [Aestuariivirga sp.]
MSKDTGISWTESTWDPIVGCSIVSPGCTNCYAQKMAHKIKHMEDARTGSADASHYFGTTKVVNGNPVWTGLLKLAPDHILTAPLRWKKPRRIFVNSMSDLFHENVPDAWIDRVFAVMALCPQHTFQILTKRSKRMREWMTPARATSVGMEGFEMTLNAHASARDEGRESRVGAGVQLTGDIAHLKLWPLPNVWLGVSCEDQERAAERVPDLLATPAAKRFVSAEPLLGPIEFRDLPVPEGTVFHGTSGTYDALSGRFWLAVGDADEEMDHQRQLACDEVKLDWIIVGGESGRGHRHMQIEWAESIMRQCEDAGTPFFFKQDSGLKPGQRGRASEDLWACKAVPV